MLTHPIDVRVQASSSSVMCSRSHEALAPSGSCYTHTLALSLVAHATGSLARSVMIFFFGSTGQPSKALVVVVVVVVVR